ncbi:hypothetical protein [Bradyrhizobium sp.]|nr:hypothetical protein [Bradyrhizobium sp.]HMM90942.1 hypothetical protein [Bradyrhizobium sp.]
MNLNSGVAVNQIRADLSADPASIAATASSAKAEENTFGILAP